MYFTSVWQELDYRPCNMIKKRKFISYHKLKTKNETPSLLCFVVVQQGGITYQTF